MKQNYSSLTTFLSDNVFKLDIIDKTRFKFSPDRYEFIKQLFKKSFSFFALLNEQYLTTSGYKRLNTKHFQQF
jgi:hypothetical protein